MASIIQIKRSGTATAPSSLALGELAYSYYDSIAGGTLYVGVGPAVDSTAVPQIASRVAAVGGEKYMTLLQAAGNPGIAVGNKFLLLDSEKAVDLLYVHGLTADSAHIKDLDVDSAYLKRLTADSAFIWKLDVDSAHIRTFTADSAYIFDLDVDSAHISRLTADSAYISQLDVDSAYISRLKGDSAYISQLDVDSGYISRLMSDSAYISQLDVDSAYISRLKGDSAYISQLDVDSAYISRLKGDSAYISQLDVDSAYISHFKADSAYINKLDVDSAHLTYAHIDGALIDSGHSLYHSFGIAHSPEYRGPATINIDPFPFGDVAGDVNIVGNLNVQGATTSVQSETVTIVDKNIVVADNASDSAWASGAGITVGGPVGASFTWQAGAAGTQYENYWTTNRLFYNKDLQADSAYFKYLKADSAFVEYLKVDKLDLNVPGGGLKIGAVAHVGPDFSLQGDSDFLYDSTNGLQIGATQGVNKGLTILPTGEVISYAPAVFDKLRVNSLVPGALLTVGLNDSIQGGELHFGEHQSFYYDLAPGASFDGLMSAKQVAQDSGWNRFIVHKSTGNVDASGVKIGSYKYRPELRNKFDANSVYFPDSAQTRDFYGLKISASHVEKDSQGRHYLQSTLPINYFKSDISKADGASIRRFPGDGVNAANDSDVSVLIRAMSLEDSSLFEVHKDGTINFTGALMQNGIPFTGGGLFAADNIDNAYFEPRDFTPTYPSGGFGRIGVGTTRSKARFEVHGGPFQVKGPLNTEAGYSPQTSGEISMAKDASTIYGTLANYDEADIDSDKGSRFSFIPGKAATRGGHFTNHNDYSWNNIGTYSVAFGKNVKAAADFSFVVGDSSSVNNGATNSIAMGQRNVVKGGNNVLIGIENSDRSGGFATTIAINSVLIGHNNTTAGNASYMFGKNNMALPSGNQTLLIGEGNKSLGGNFNNIIGLDNTADGNSSFIFGYQDSVSGLLAFAFGYDNKVSGNQSFAIGHDQIIQGANSFAIGGGGKVVANNSMNISLRPSTATPGAGQDPANTLRNIVGQVDDENLLAIQGGNVSIGRESDMFNPATQGAGNLFVGGSILYGGEVFKLNPFGGAPIAGNPFEDNGQFILMETPRNVGIGKTAPNTEFDVRGDFQVDGTTLLTYASTDSAIFDSAGTFPGNTYNNMFMYSSRAGLIRAGKVLLDEHVNSDLGIFSIGMGEEPYARGKNSISLGEKNKVGQRRSQGNIVLRGTATTTQGRNSIAIGKENIILTDNNLFLGQNNIQDSINSGTDLYTIGRDNLFGLANASTVRSTNKSYVIGTSNTLYTNGNQNFIFGESNEVFHDNFTNNYIIGTGWKDSHSVNNVNPQYGGITGGGAKNTTFIGGNAFIPTGLENGIVIMKPAIFNDSGPSLFDSALVNKGLNNTNIMIGKTAQVAHGNSTIYNSGFNRNYTLDIHGDVNIDSGATLHIGGLNIKDYIAGTAPTIVVTGVIKTSPIVPPATQTSAFTVSSAAAAIVSIPTGTGGHLLGSAGGAGTGLAVKFSNLTDGAGGPSSSFNYTTAADNVYFVQAVDADNFELFTDRACTIALDTSSETIVVPSAAPTGSYEVVTVVQPVSGVGAAWAFDTTGTNLTITSTAHGLTVGDGVRLSGITGGTFTDLNGNTYFVGPDANADGLLDAGYTNKFELFTDDVLTVPVLSADYTGTPVTTSANYIHVIPQQQTTSSANLNVLGKLTVGDSATVEGSVHFRQSVSGSTFTIGDNTGTGERMSFDSFVVRPTGGLIPILENHLDSAYVQARVSIDNFWALKGGNQLINDQSPGRTNPVVINKNNIDVNAADYEEVDATGNARWKFQLDMDGKARIDIPAAYASRPGQDAPSEQAAANHRSPIITTNQAGNPAAWPTEDYIATIVTNDYVKNRMNIDSAVISSVIDSGYMKTIISPNYILHHANDSSHWRRSADGHTLYFGGVGFNSYANVAIGADSAPIDHPGSKLYVRGDVRVDSGFSAGGHSIIEGSKVTVDSEYIFNFTVNAADSYFITHPNSIIYGDPALSAILLSEQPGLTYGESAADFSISGTPGLDSEFMSVMLVTPKDVTNPLTSGFDSTALTKGTLNAVGNGIATGDWAWVNANQIKIREQSVPGYDSIGHGRPGMTHTHSIDIINRGLHTANHSVSGNLLGVLRLQDTDNSTPPNVLQYVKNGLTNVYIDNVLLESGGEKWEEVTNSLIHIYDSEANTRLPIGAQIKVKTRSRKNDASLTVKGPLSVIADRNLRNPQILLSGNLNIASEGDSGSAKATTQFTFEDSAIFKTGFTLDSGIGKIQNGGLLFSYKERRADEAWRTLYGGAVWDSIGQAMTSGESAEFYFGPYYPASYDSAKGFNLVNPYVGRSFDSNIMRIVNDDYIGSRITDPWNRIGTSPNQQIYYDEEGGVIIGKKDMIDPFDQTRFAVDSGNVLFLSSILIDSSEHPKAGVVPRRGDGTQIDSGSRLMWIPGYGSFRAGYVDGTNVTWDSGEVGIFSQGIGANVLATDHSTAIGYNVSAGNVDYAANGYTKQPLHTTRVVSIGHTITNPGQFSVAVGKDITNSNKQNSLSLGIGITNVGAKGTSKTDEGGVAIGKTLETGRGVVIGRDITGDDGNQPSHVNNTAIGSLLVNTNKDAVTIGYNLTGGEAGLNIGRDNYPTSSATAPGKNSILIGQNNTTGNGGMAIGHSSAAGITAVAIGSSVVASGSTSTAIGIGSKSAGNNSIAIGINTEATGRSAISYGVSNKASGNTSMVFGKDNIGNGNSSVTFGVNNTTGKASQIFGSNNTGISETHVFGSANLSTFKNAKIHGDANETVNNSAKVYGNENKNIVYSSEVYGSSNENWYDTRVYGSDNVNLTGRSSSANGGQGNYIFGGQNIQTKGGNIYGTRNDVTGFGDAYGKDNIITDFGWAYGDLNTIVNGGHAYGYENTVDGGTSTFAYAFGSKNNVGENGFGFGKENTVSNGGMALGSYAQASGNGAISIGSGVSVTGTNSVAIGSYTSSSIQVTVSDNNVIALMGGTVGVNKVSPNTAYMVDIDGSINWTGDAYHQGQTLYHYIRNNVANQSWIRFNADAAWVQSHIDPTHYRATMPASMYFYNDATTSYLYTTAPRVGIKTTSPSYDLDVNGSVNVQSLYWQGDKILDSHQGNQVYLTHQTAQFYIGPDSATEYFDSDYVFERQQNHGFTKGQTYQQAIDQNYIMANLDDTAFLNSDEGIGLVNQILTTNNYMKRELSGVFNGNLPGFKMGIGAIADPNYHLLVSGNAKIQPGNGKAGNLEIGNIGDNSQIILNGVALNTSNLLQNRIGGYIVDPDATTTRSPILYDLTSSIGNFAIDIGTDFTGPGGPKSGINIAEGMKYHIDGVDIIDGILDSAFINRRVQKEDLTADGKLDSDHFKFIINSEYIKSIADSDYVKTVADSDYIRSIADSDYIKSIADSDYIKFIANDVYIKSIADSDYIKSAADSDYIKSIADSDYIKSVADSDYVKSIADSDYIKGIIDSDYVKAIADSDYVKSIVDSDYVKSIVDSDYIKFVADSDYIKSIADSAHVNLITGIGSRPVDFGSHNITFKSSASNTGALPNAATHTGMVAVTTGDNTARIAKSGNWQGIPLENTNVTFNTILPGADKLFDLGSSTAAWRDLYLSGSTIHLGGIRIKESNGVFTTTDSLGVALPIDLSGATTKNLTEDSNLYYTDLRVDSNITGKDLDMGTNKILYSNVYSALSDLPSAASYHGMFAHVHATGKAYFAHAGSWVDLASGADITTAINNLIDGAPAAMDTLNEFATALGNDANFSTTITALIGEKYDSVGVRTLVDSAYVQARVVPQGIDSSAVSGMVDSAYVQARQTISTFDSAEVLQLIDSDYILARSSAGVTTLGALTDVNAPSPTDGQALVYNTATSKWIPGAASGGGGGSADSATIIALIDSDYIQARQTSSGAAVSAEYSNFRFTATANQTTFSGADVAGNTLAVTATGIQVYLNGIHLLKDIDYTVSGTTGVVLTTGANVGDDLVITNISTGTGANYILAGETNFKDYKFRATAGQTAFTGNDLNSQSLSITDSNHQVYLNGIRLNRVEDYNVNSSTNTVTLTLGAADSDDVVIQTLTRSTTGNVLTLPQDVHTTPPTEGQILIWDNSNSYWAPGVLPAGTDSAAVTGMIDSAYVAARSTGATAATYGVSFANYYFQADSGQTVFSGNDKNGLPLAIDTDNYQVFNNGIRLVSGVDYTVNAAANSLTLNGFTADSGDDLVINTLLQTTSHIMVGDTFINTFKFIATNGQTAFTGADANSKTLGIDSSNFSVFQNGIKLMDSDDFTSNPITNTITLTSGASASDEITITAIENKAGNVTVNEQALQGLVDSAYVAARVNIPAAWAEIATTPITAVAGQRLIVDTSTAKTVNLPVAASLGDEIRIIDGTGQAATNAITIGRNGHKIEGGDSDLTIDVNRAAFGLVYYNVANGWLFTEK
mgnify:CR=1 FL=1